MSTFGTTLTDLQAGMNAAQGLENQRSNFQDQISAQKLSDFLKARSEENRTKAQRDAYMAQILESQQSRGQQGRQFDAEMQNRLDLGRLDAQTREKVATIGAGARGMDPRFAQTIADIQAMNNENKQKFDYATQLSAARRSIAAQLKGMMANRGFMDFGTPNRGFFDRRVDPQYAELEKQLARLDADAAALNLAVDPASGGYLVAPFTPIETPAMFNQALPSVAPVTPGSPPPPVIPPADAYEFGQVMDAFRALDQQSAGPIGTGPAVAPRRVWRLLPDGRTVLAQ